MKTNATRRRLGAQVDVWLRIAIPLAFVVLGALALWSARGQ